jgi:hypothetical protein
VAEDNQAFDFLEASKPGAKSLNRGVVDVAIASEGGDRGWNETSQIKGFHVRFSFGSMKDTLRLSPPISEDSELTFQI